MNGERDEQQESNSQKKLLQICLCRSLLPSHTQNLLLQEAACFSKSHQPLQVVPVDSITQFDHSKFLIIPYRSRSRTFKNCIHLRFRDSEDAHLFHVVRIGHSRGIRDISTKRHFVDHRLSVQSPRALLRSSSTSRWLSS